MGGKTSAASHNKYNTKAYDRIAIMAPKGGKSEIKAAADRAGQSVNAYILEAVQQRMTADGNSTDNGGKL
jgi:predicted HicB family RNase H-like nuclease